MGNANILYVVSWKISTRPSAPVGRVRKISVIIVKGKLVPRNLAGNVKLFGVLWNEL